jgi:hypothetical protein
MNLKYRYRDVNSLSLDLTPKNPTHNIEPHAFHLLQFVVILTSLIASYTRLHFVGILICHARYEFAEVAESTLVLC